MLHLVSLFQLSPQTSINLIIFLTEEQEMCESKNYTMQNIIIQGRT